MSLNELSQDCDYEKPTPSTATEGVTKCRKEGRRRGRSSKNGGLKWWRRLKLPRRGRKDTMLAPTPLTALQGARLREKRQQLFESIVAPRACRASALALADWDPESGCAKVVQARGAALQSMGWFENRIHRLFPEEALFLVDKGCLEIRLNGLPMSMQRVWACALSSPLALPVSVYMTYAHLHRSGFVVRRFERLTMSDTLGKCGDAVENRSNGERCDDDRDTDCTDAITPDLAVWRVGSYSRRKEDARHEPQFYVKVYGMEEASEQLGRLCQWGKFANKCRFKIALVDRAMVLMLDVASNATPLSQRFTDRLPLNLRNDARLIANGDASGVFPKEILAQWNQDQKAPAGLLNDNAL